MIKGIHDINNISDISKYQFLSGTNGLYVVMMLPLLRSFREVLTDYERSGVGVRVSPIMMYDNDRGGLKDMDIMIKSKLETHKTKTRNANTRKGEPFDLEIQ